MNRWNNLIDLKGDSAPMEVINQRILSDATIEGTNLIVLVMAIMIACIGLNLNSVAVIIGAMLISPLMGGIVATGYGMATYDVPFIRKSLIKLSFQVGLAVLTASIYFLLKCWPGLPRRSGMSSSPYAAGLPVPSGTRGKKRAMSSPASPSPRH